MSILKHSGLRALGTASVAACVLVACGGSGSANGDAAADPREPDHQGRLAGWRLRSHPGPRDAEAAEGPGQQVRQQQDDGDRRHHDRPDRRERRADVQRLEPDPAARAGRLGIQRAARLRHDDLRARHPGAAATSRSSSSTAPWAAAVRNRRLARRWIRSRRRSRAKCRPTARRRLRRRAETGRRSDRGRHGQPCRPFYPCETRSRTTRR